MFVIELTRKWKSSSVAALGVDGFPLPTDGKRLGVENAIIDGEIVILNQAGLSDYQALRQGHNPPPA
ncbi:hypothetical protein NLY43_03075 [Mesorhizobium sp. C416B]|uniref:hypothetical protein n=1 Tax=Mesorhizobium sp. C416B TaxID=2956834 RepID=UPI0003CE850F|nr:MULTISPECIES: hypothetical protein [unclassified Mesorhizobium]ESX46927.1 hypothetical protein X761_30625 [Mesorhizobium sp. LSHC424B00]WJI63774.1 hypothetical protein NLY43_03075 [Mesorhizobium sp. C416B]